jgi:hypothetical protein
MLANLLAVEPSAVLRVGFVDELVAGLVGVDGVSEFPSRMSCSSGPTARTTGRCGRRAGRAVAPGAYRWGGDRLEQGHAGEQREIAADLCFDQPLDSA